MKQYYTEYKCHIISCPFCDKHTNVYYAKQHLKSNSCKKFQTNSNELTKKTMEFNKKINQIKSQIKFNLE